MIKKPSEKDMIIENQQDQQNDDLFAKNFKISQKYLKNNVPQEFKQLQHQRQTYIKDPKFSEQEYKKIWSFLKRDQVNALAIFMEDNQRMPDPFYQISIYQEQQYWTMVHACCKYNAVRCLQWVLTSAFFEKPQYYISFVNSKTSDEETALTIALIQGSIDCYNLLLRFGGLNLTLTYGKENYIQLAYSNQRRDIFQKLKKFAKLGVFYLNVQDNEFDIQKFSNVLNQSKKQALDRIRTQNQKFDINNFVSQIDQSLNNQIQITKLLEDQIKKDLKKNKEQWSKQSKQNQSKLLSNRFQTRKRFGQEIFSIGKQEYVRKRADSQANIKRSQSLNRLKLQNHHKGKQQAIRKQVLKKQAELKQKKRQRTLKLNQDEQKRMQQKANVQTLIREELIKKQKGLIKLSKEHIAQKILQENVQIQDEERQKNEKDKANQQQIETGIIQSRKYGSFVQLPQEIQNIYKGIKYRFQDPQFPPKQSSLGEKIPQKLKHSVWLRAKDILQTRQFKLFDGIHPNGITQGALGVCYYLSTISSLADNPQRIQRLFAFADIDKGFYVLKFYILGKITHIVVDDFFPCHKTTKTPLFARPKTKQVWVMVLQKAWAKQFGAYLRAEAMSADLMMQKVTGAPSRGIWINKYTKQDLFDILLDHNKKESIMVATSHNEQKIPGIDTAHAYSIISVHRFEDHQILKLRNPWGQLQWDGQYNQTSDIWTPELKQQVGFQDGITDGQFFISLNQFQIAFSYISLGMIKHGYQSNYIDVQATNQDQYFQFSIKSQCSINLRVCQPFKRFTKEIRHIWKDQEYAYSPFIFEIIDITREIFLQEGGNNTNFGAKSVHWNQKGFKKILPGDYIVRIKFFPKMDPVPNCTLCSYSPQKIQFQRINDKQYAFNCWSKGMANWMSQQQQIDQIAGQTGYAMKWMKGQLLIYAQGQQNQQIIFKFNKQNFKNCKTGFRKSQKNDCDIIVPSGQVGSIDKIVIKNAAGTGGFTVIVRQKGSKSQQQQQSNQQQDKKISDEESIQINNCRDLNSLKLKEKQDEYIDLIEGQKTIKCTKLNQEQKQ